VVAESSLVQYLRSGRDQRARIDEAVAAFRRLAPSDYGHFLATIEADLGESVRQLETGVPRLMLAAGSSSPEKSSPIKTESTAAKSPAVKHGSLREAVLGVLADGQPRSSREIRDALTATRLVKTPTFNTEMFTLRKLGLVRSEGSGNARKHSIVILPPPSPARSSSSSRDRAPRAARRKRQSDDEDHPERRSRSLDAEQIYSRAIGGHPLLTKAEELELARRLEITELEIWTRLLASPLAPEVRRQLRAHDPPIADASVAEVRKGDPDRQIATRVFAEDRDRLSADDRAALRALDVEADRIRARFATCNLRLVPSVIRKHAYHLTSNLPMSDLIQEGNLGLLKAISRFDYRHGCRFSTFAAWWIRHYVVRARQNHSSDVRVPVHMQELAFRVRRARKQLSDELGRDPTRGEIAEVLRVSVKNLQTLESTWLRHRQALPTFDSVGDAEGREPSQLVSDAEPVDAILVQLQEDAQIAVAIDGLPPVLAQVLRSRYGIGGGEPMMLEQIGRRLQRSKERVRQLLEKALVLLRARLTSVSEISTSP
jgi:RNA polymerase primary sigma factor